MIRILLAVIIVVGCKVANTDSKAKFITVAHDDPERFVNGKNILIKRVHEEHWNISYGFHKNCPVTRKTEENYRVLRENIERGIRVWLEPLKGFANRPIVDKFIFHKKYNRNENIDYEVHILFSCEVGLSIAGRSTRSITMRSIEVEVVETVFSPSLPYYISALIHELGHAFDLADTYVTNPTFSPPSTGGIANSIGRQPRSVMSIGIGCEGRWSLCLDDERAIQWLYRYHYEGLDPKNCPPEFLYEELTHEGKTVGGCILKQPLLVSLRQGHLLNARELLGNDKGIKINDKDKHGYSALHYLAPLKNEVDAKSFVRFTIKVLKHPDIDVNITDNYGNTPLHWAVWFGNRECYWAWDLIFLTKTKGVFPERKELKVNIQNTYGETALHFAAKLGRDNCIDTLIRRSDIDLNITEHRAGNTPLHEAAKNGHTEIVKMLLAHDGINRNIRNRGGKTARELAELSGYEETVRAFD